MRLRPLGLLLFGVVASSACSVDATRPSPLAPSGPAARRESATSLTTYRATIDPQRDTVLSFGAYTLELPGNAVCNRDAGYGLESFDLDCKAEKGSVTIVAMVRPVPGAIPRIDFLPELRFNPKRIVTLRVAAPAIQMASPTPRILYCATLVTDVCVNEAELDPSLATYVDPASRTVFRRIKHFSGYFVEW